MIKIEIDKLGVVRVYTDDNMLLSAPATSALVTVLRFYADEKNWIAKVRAVGRSTNVGVDGGFKAREALKVEELNG